MRRSACVGLCAALVVLATPGTSVPAAAETGALAQSSRLKPLRLRETCVTRAERQHVLRFRASDGVRLIGVLLGSGPRAVILAHQGASDLCIWAPFARTLAARGYRVLIFDHRGFGSSGQASRSTRRDRVDYDVLGAIAALRSRGATSIVLGGASLGAAAVLSAAARSVPPVSGVFSLSSPSRYKRMNIVNAVRAFRVTALFLATEEDHPFTEEAQELYDADGFPEKQLMIFSGFEHGVFMLGKPDAQGAVDAFIARYSP
ncbi:MAG: alpha/beta fold hydrolase [Actinomycetota bacterium]